jgi:hypothetical protein
MGIAEIRMIADEHVIDRLRRIAASRNTDVGTLLGGVARAIAGESWRAVPIGPQTREALGVAGRLPDVPDEQLLEDALTDERPDR